MDDEAENADQPLNLLDVLAAVFIGIFVGGMPGYLLAGAVGGVLGALAGAVVMWWIAKGSKGKGFYRESGE